MDCDCICAIRHPARSRECSGTAITAIWDHGITVRLCYPCTTVRPS